MTIYMSIIYSLLLVKKMLLTALNIELANTEPVLSCIFS